MSEVKMVYEITINKPTIAEGTPVQIPGLGTFENGKTYEVSEAEATSYRAYHAQQIPNIGKGSEILGSVTQLGATLAEASDVMYGVEVRDIDKTVQVQSVSSSDVSANDVDETGDEDVNSFEGSDD